MILLCGTNPVYCSISLVARNGKTAGQSVKAATNLATDTGTGIWGPTHSYPFAISFPAATGLSGIKASGQSFPFQDTMFVVPSLSSVSPSLPAFSTTPALNAVATYSLNLTVAVSPSFQEFPLHYSRISFT